jgi:hypothetical protein
MKASYCLTDGCRHGDYKWTAAGQTFFIFLGIAAVATFQETYYRQDE